MSQSHRHSTPADPRNPKPASGCQVCMGFATDRASAHSTEASHFGDALLMEDVPTWQRVAPKSLFQKAVKAYAAHLMRFFLCFHHVFKQKKHVSCTKLLGTNPTTLHPYTYFAWSGSKHFQGPRKSSMGIDLVSQSTCGPGRSADFAPSFKVFANSAHGFHNYCSRDWVYQ